MLTVLGRLAEFERDLIRARAAEGRDRAKGRDVDGEPIRDIARTYNVHNSTISRLAA